MSTSAIVRIFNTYGPRLRAADGRVVSNFVVQAMDGRPLTVYGDGSQTRSVLLRRRRGARASSRSLDSGLVGPDQHRQPGRVHRARAGATSCSRSPDRAPSSSSSRCPPTIPRGAVPISRSRVSMLGWEPKVTLREGLRARTSGTRRNGRRDAHIGLPGDPDEPEPRVQEALGRSCRCSTSATRSRRSCGACAPSSCRADSTARSSSSTTAAPTAAPTCSASWATARCAWSPTRENRGKGAAVRTGFAHSTGDLILIQDADLEYDPEDWPKLLAPVLRGKAVVVYGSRFTGERRNMLFFHWVGNRFLSLVTNVLYNSTLSDMETCYKLISRSVFESLDLRADHFDIEPEITAKILRRKIRIYEVPISYAGREIHEGKKISWRDGFSALVDADQVSCRRLTRAPTAARWAAVVVSYNYGDLLEQCVRSILADDECRRARRRRRRQRIDRRLDRARSAPRSRPRGSSRPLATSATRGAPTSASPRPMRRSSRCSTATSSSCPASPASMIAALDRRPARRRGRAARAQSRRFGVPVRAHRPGPLRRAVARGARSRVEDEPVDPSLPPARCRPDARAATSTGSRAPRCGSGARRSTTSAGGTSATSCTWRTSTCACGCGARDGASSSNRRARSCTRRVASTSKRPYRMIAEHHRSVWRFASRRYRGWRRPMLVPLAAVLALRCLAAMAQHAWGRPSMPRVTG